MPPIKNEHTTYMRLTEGSAKAAWLLQAIRKTETRPNWIAGTHEDWSAATGLTPFQVRDAIRIISRLNLIERKQAWVKELRKPALHVRSSPKTERAFKMLQAAEDAPQEDAA